MEKIKEITDKIPKWLLNKFAITTVLFIFWMVFLDKYNLFTQFGMMSDIRKLKQEKLMYAEKIEKLKAEKEAFEHNLEKYAREKYLMHKSNEDVYIVLDKSK